MKYWIDFSGYCSIEAENEQDAREKFYDAMADAWLGENIEGTFFEIENTERKGE